ncbi:MAG TPA: mandelate racemase/muconate lactonizing enzyme family protein [Bryobacteraceae bacterium]|jgi:L-alanine-DL-glutamate epimerase-like enolase superfamily enzyme
MTRRTLLSLAAAVSPLGRGLATAAEMKKEMKITGIETDLLRLPQAEFTGDAIHDFGSASGGVVLRVLTNAGITGWGYSNFGMIEGGPRVVQTILESEIKPVINRQDPAFPKKIRADLWRALEYQGVQGVTQFAMSLVDIAVWDILGKAAGLPVYKMLGAVRDRMPVYAMCGWYRENDRDHSQYKRTINEALEIGYRAFKVKVGRLSLDDDVERIEVGRNTAGKDIRIMVDANQAYNRVEALVRGRAYQQLGCFWYEEPLPPWDHEGYAELAQALDMRIATGENEYNKHAFMDLLLKKGADVVQPDNRRAGGPTEWMELAAIADGFGAELASHGGGPVDMNILCAIPNAIYMESGGKQKIVNGAVLAPESPGMSSEVSRDFINAHKIA